jgi:hypothetical protein
VSRISWGNGDTLKDALSSLAINFAAGNGAIDKFAEQKAKTPPVKK